MLEVCCQTGATLNRKQLQPLEHRHPPCVIAMVLLLVETHSSWSQTQHGDSRDSFSFRDHSIIELVRFPSERAHSKPLRLCVPAHGHIWSSSARGERHCASPVQMLVYHHPDHFSLSWTSLLGLILDRWSSVVRKKRQVVYHIKFCHLLMRLQESTRDSVNTACDFTYDWHLYQVPINKN